jgi:hypothetical protein
MDFMKYNYILKYIILLVLYNIVFFIFFNKILLNLTSL